ncbi:exodeoxyribonuclease VII large subunit [Bacillus sp. FJAT-45350]|uniref:exodeoxyribonuclease VII large subunit n=1 Tax=Bacillus sp. FJAT-45350 TaxID=2011014 RepID=UPI000BB720B7|nr:exodeoxyribonuclease VII large subunit [Bacillus sp. FJAT-45350]
MGTEQILTVSDATKYIKRTFEEDDLLQDIWIRGELSNFKQHSRGHMYFTIKDEHSRMQGVMFAGNNRFLKFRPEDGMKVLIRGNVTVYEPYGSYQMYAREMQPDGVGSLYLAFEELKGKLQREGLFAEDNKKPLPSCPTRIAIVTSPTGAAIRDMITTIKRRFPMASITLLPVLVQGDEAAPSIVKGIEQANAAGIFDVLIVGRGGGSIEDLWAFNEEIVARAIYHSMLPIISAVGHETDITIADFVADIRAATPTAAAELAVPSSDELYERLSITKARMIRAMKERYSGESKRLQQLQKSYAFRYPVQLVKQKEQDLDRLLERLEKEANRAIDRKKDKLSQLHKDLKRNHPKAKIADASERHKELVATLKRQMNDITKEKNHLFQASIAKLNMLSPLKVMERGYSLVYSGENKLVKTVNQLEEGNKVQIQLKDGQLMCEVKEKVMKRVGDNDE